MKRKIYKVKKNQHQNYTTSPYKCVSFSSKYSCPFPQNISPNHLSASKSAERQASVEEDLQSLDMRSILAGGNLIGWTPDVAVVMWRRLLGILGDVNQIVLPDIHERVMEHLCHIVETLIKVNITSFILHF
jgi:hypothetical protein